MKIIKRIFLFILVAFIVLIGATYLYKDTLIKKGIAYFNDNYNIKIAYNDVDFSVLKHFPYATLTVSDLNVTTEIPFDKDTLFYAKKVFFDINIKDAFSKNVEKINIKDIRFSSSKINVLVDANGHANYAIKYTGAMNNSVKTDTVSKNIPAKKFTFAVEKYELENAQINYQDIPAKIKLNVKNFNHTGKGDFSANNTILKTISNADKLSFSFGDVTYFNKVKMNLKADFDLDFEQSKYSFKENTAKINDLVFNFNGFVQMLKDETLVDINFSSNKANFKSILSLIPNAYASNFKEVNASGNALVKGFVKGKSTNTKTPQYQIAIKTEKASFQYPNLPKGVNDISLDAKLSNNSSNNNPFLTLNKMHFKVDEDEFNLNGNITNLLTNPTSNINLKGDLNLANLAKAYPIDLEKKISGKLNANIHLEADSKSIKTNDFKKIKTNGHALLTDFLYKDDLMSNPVQIELANLDFDTKDVKLSNFKAKTGKSDVKANGVLTNFFGFLFDHKKLKGNFNMNADTFYVNDFLVKETPSAKAKNTSNEQKKSSNEEKLEIPNFLDITTNITANKVYYDNLVLENVQGKMQIVDQKAIFNHTKAKMLQGNFVLNGEVDTKKENTNFNMDLAVNKFDIASSFKELDLFKALVPVANIMHGKYDSTFHVQGNLNQDMTPNLSTLSGKVLAELFVDSLADNKSELANALQSNLSFLDIKKINLKNLIASLSFKNGQVHVNPFKINYQDIALEVEGSHGFDTSLTYNMHINVPAKYLGKEAQDLLAQVSDANKDTISVPLNAFLKGNILKPKITADYKSAIKDLAVKVVKYKKEEYVNEVKDKVNNGIKDILSNNGLDSILPVSTDTTKTGGTNNIIKDGVNQVLNGLFKKKKKKK